MRRWHVRHRHSRRPVEERVSEHAQGLADSYTSRRLPVEPIFSETYEREDEAVAVERRFKGEASDRKGRSGFRTNPMR
jgi:putative endonuclease